MKAIICKECGAPYMGREVEGEPRTCQVCSSEDFKELDISKMHEIDPLEVGE